MPLISLCTPCKHQKPEFSIFSEGIEGARYLGVNLRLLPGARCELI